jgi:hypothetical protein
MKATRKQKLRKREEKRRRASDRRLADVLRLFDMYGVTELVDPLAWVDPETLCHLLPGPTKVEIAPQAQAAPVLHDLRVMVEEYVDAPREFVAPETDLAFSLTDFFRGAFTVPVVIAALLHRARWPNSDMSRAVRARLEEALAQTQRFESRVSRTIPQFIREIDEILEQAFRLDHEVVWHRFVRGKPWDPATRGEACRIVLHHREQRPLHVPVADGRRKVYPCLGADLEAGMVPTRWNPAGLGLGPETRDLPVLISDHAIARLHERLPLAPDLGRVHRLMSDALAFPKFHPADDAGKFLVEVGPDQKRVGYFLVEIYPDFVFVKTFLFLTMHGTPESRALRRRLGLSRGDIEYFKLDHFFTLASSDLANDPELKRALAECGCGHLLELSDGPWAFSWLGRYGARLRREIGLPAPLEADPPRQPGDREIDKMIARSHEILKLSEGWTI